MNVCDTEHVFHALLNTGDEIIASILVKGLRPLSDFPESERWQQINAQMPGFFENLYEMIAADVLQKPYMNAGVFVSPIDFQRLPASIMHGKTRVKIPVSRIDPEYACLTYVLDGKRTSLPFVPTDWVFRFLPYICRDRVRFMYRFNQLSFGMGLARRRSRARSHTLARKFCPAAPTCVLFLFTCICALEFLSE